MNYSIHFIISRDRHQKRHNADRLRQWLQLIPCIIQFKHKVNYTKKKPRPFFYSLAFTYDVSFIGFIYIQHINIPYKLHTCQKNKRQICSSRRGGMSVAPNKKRIANKMIEKGNDLAYTLVCSPTHIHTYMRPSKMVLQTLSTYLLHMACGICIYGLKMA